MLTTTSRMEVGCREVRAIHPWLANPKYQPRDPTLGVVRHPSHWITVEKDRCQGKKNKKQKKNKKKTEQKQKKTKKEQQTKKKKKKQWTRLGLKVTPWGGDPKERGGQQKQPSHSSRWKEQWEQLWSQPHVHGSALTRECHGNNAEHYNQRWRSQG